MHRDRKVEKFNTTSKKWVATTGINTLVDVNVDKTTLANGHQLTYNDTAKCWTNAAASGGSGYAKYSKIAGSDFFDANNFDTTGIDPTYWAKKDGKVYSFHCSVLIPVQNPSTGGAEVRFPLFQLLADNGITTLSGGKTVVGSVTLYKQNNPRYFSSGNVSPDTNGIYVWFKNPVDATGAQNQLYVVALSGYVLIP